MEPPFRFFWITSNSLNSEVGTERGGNCGGEMQNRFCRRFRTGSIISTETNPGTNTTFSKLFGYPGDWIRWINPCFEDCSNPKISTSELLLYRYCGSPGTRSKIRQTSLCKRHRTTMAVFDWKPSSEQAGWMKKLECPYWRRLPKNRSTNGSKVHTNRPWLISREFRSKSTPKKKISLI